MKDRTDSGERLSAYQEQGDRPTQQDRCSITPHNGGLLFAVFDGHGGEETAALAAREVVPIFEEVSRPSVAPLEAIRETVRKLARLTAGNSSGSTASLVWLPPERLKVYIALLGDSPVAVLDIAEQLVVPPLHNVRDNPQELQKAVARGALYREGYLEDPLAGPAGLQMSRALGDQGLGRILDREPDCLEVSVGTKSCVIVGSDGLLDSARGSVEGQMSRLIELVRQGGDAKTLVEDAVLRRTGDNVSALVWCAGTALSSGQPFSKKSSK